MSKECLSSKDFRWLLFLAVSFCSFKLNKPGFYNYFFTSNTSHYLMTVYAYCPITALIFMYLSVYDFF